MRLRTIAGTAFLLFAAPVFVAPAAGQELGTDCELREYATLSSSAPAPGRRVTWLSRPFLVCPDGTRIRSDSAIVHEAGGRAELMGRVHIQLPTRELRSNRADYFETEGRLFARGSVVFTDPQRGSVITGDTLVYQEARSFQPEDLLTVSGGRPTATLPPMAGRSEAGPEGQPEPVPADPAAPPSAEGYTVVGDRLRFEGDRFFWADGNVEVRRDDLEAYADSLAFDQEEGRLILNRNARVVGEVEMQGDQITLIMPGEVLQAVTIRGRGRLDTDDLEVVGEEIQITMEDEQIQRLVAVHRPSGGEEEGPRPRPRAVTEDFVIEGDSIDVEAPGEVLQTLYASGRARGERVVAAAASLPAEIVDALEPDPDEAPEREVSEGESGLLDRDWIEGDEILALFEPEPSVEAPDPDAPDPEIPVTEPEEGVGTGARVRLERLEARGNARTLYRSPPEEDPDADPDLDDEPVLWSFSYIKAQEILIHMLAGEVDQVEALGNVEGIQIEPLGRGSTAEGSAPSPPGPNDGSDDGQR